MLPSILTEIPPILIQENEKEPDIRVIVRLKTTYWSDRRGLHARQDLLYMRRLSTGFNFVEGDASNMGADEVVPLILNLNRCEDGLYQIIPINEQRDWETGYVESWEYELIPYEPPTGETK